MAYLTFSWWDYTLFFIMVGCSFIIGIYYGFLNKKRFTTTEYIYGGRQMKVFPVSMSMVASAISVTDLLAIPAEIYMHGTQYWVMILAVPIMGLLMNYIYLPIIYELNLKSAYEYLEIRFDKNVRRFATVCFLVPGLFFMTLFIYAPALAFNQVSGFSVRIIAPVISLICIFYTTTGGLKAVVWTDTLQFTITLCTMAFTLIMGTISVGGFAEIWRKSTTGGRIEFFEMNPDPTMRSTFWNVFIGHIIFWSAQAIVYPALIQRFISLPTLEDSRRALLIFVVGSMVTRSIMCFSGLIIYARYFDCDPLSIGHIEKIDQILPYYIMDVANYIPGLSALFIAGLFSTGLSVLSTFLNAFSGSLYMDIISPFMPITTSERKANNIMKLITLVLGIFGVAMIFVTEKFGSIFELCYTLLGIASGPALGLFVMGLGIPIVNSKGALFGGIASLAFMSWFIVRKQIYVWNGAIQYDSKPMITDGCNLTSSFSNKTLDYDIITADEPPWLFRISFHYYYLMGFLITVFGGIITSWITRRIGRSAANPDILTAVKEFTSKTGTTVYRFGENTNNFVEIP